MRRILAIILCIMCAMVSYGQISPLNTHFSLLKYKDNPAYAGLDFSLSVQTMVRNQWQGQDRAPREMYLGAHVPLYVISGAGGFDVRRVSYGSFAFTEAHLSYNYIRPMLGGLLSSGIRLGGVFGNFDKSLVVTPDGVYDPITDHRDPLLAEGGLNGRRVQTQLGVYYYSKRFQIGASYASLIGNKVGFPSFDVNFNDVLRAFAQYDIRILDNAVLRPMVGVYATKNLVQTQVMMLFENNGNIFGGIGARGYDSKSVESVLFVVGGRINKNYTISYSFDYGTGGFGKDLSGSHELVLSYNFAKRIKTGSVPKIIYNPRNL